METLGRAAGVVPKPFGAIVSHADLLPHFGDMLLFWSARRRSRGGIGAAALAIFYLACRIAVSCADAMSAPQSMVPEILGKKFATRGCGSPRASMLIG